MIPLSKSVAPLNTECAFICVLRLVVLQHIVFNAVEQELHFVLIIEIFVKYFHNNDLGTILINN